MYESEGAPLPSLGSASGFAVPGRQPWQLPGARELLTRSGLPGEAFFGVVCDQVTLEDHRRCLAAAVPWNWLWEALFLVYLIVMVTVVITWRQGIGSFMLGAGFIALVATATLLFFVKYAFWRVNLTRATTARANQTASTAMMLLANADGLYHVTNDFVAATPWELVGGICAVHGDVLIQGNKHNKIDGWFYVPRRAFANEADARLFADTLRALVKENGDPSVLPPEPAQPFLPYKR